MRDVEKEYEGRNDAMIAQLNAKEGELTKARDLVKLHEAVPTMSRPAPGVGRQASADEAGAPADSASPPAKCPSASSSRIL